MDNYISEKEKQLTEYIRSRLNESCSGFSKDGYSVDSHAAMLRSILSVIEAWQKVKTEYAKLNEGGL